LYYTNFKILAHKALKKLALEYFPELTEISAAGIREIDYMLYRPVNSLQKGMAV